MKLTSNYSVRMAAGLVIVGIMALLPAPRAAAQSPLDDIAVGRDLIKIERTAAVAEAMQLTEEEGQVFWPLYREYRDVIEGINDRLLVLVLEYADVYPNVAEDRAWQMLKKYNALEEDRLEARAKFVKKVARKLTASKALRLAQVENRLDLVIRMQMAGAIPLVPAQAK